MQLDMDAAIRAHFEQ